MKIKNIIPLLLSCSMFLNSCMTLRTVTNPESYKNSSETLNERFLHKSPFVKIKTIDKDKNEIKAYLYSYPVNAVDKVVKNSYYKENEWSESIIGDLFVYGLTLGIIWWMGDAKNQKELTWKKENDDVLKWGAVSIGVDFLGAFIFSIPYSKNTYTSNYKYAEYTEKYELQKNTDFKLINNGKELALKTDENGVFTFPINMLLKIPDALNFEDNFKTNKNNWISKDDEVAYINVGKGRLKFKHNLKDASYSIYLNRIIDTSKDFSLEWESEKISGDENQFYTFLFKNNKYFYNFGISGTGAYIYSKYDLIKKERNNIFEKASQNINRGNSKNKFKISLKDNQMYFYINNNLIEDRRFEDDINGIGFQISGAAEVNFYNLNFYYQNQKPLTLSIKDSSTKFIETNFFLSDLISSDSNYDLDYLRNISINIEYNDNLNNQSNELLKDIIKGLKK